MKNERFDLISPRKEGEPEYTNLQLSRISARIDKGIGFITKMFLVMFGVVAVAFTVFIVVNERNADDRLRDLAEQREKDRRETQEARRGSCARSQIERDVLVDNNTALITDSLIAITELQNGKAAGEAARKDPSFSILVNIIRENQREQILKRGCSDEAINNFLKSAPDPEVCEGGESPEGFCIYVPPATKTTLVK